MEQTTKVRNKDTTKQRKYESTKVWDNENTKQRVRKMNVRDCETTRAQNNERYKSAKQRNCETAKKKGKYETTSKWIYTST